MIQTLAQTIIWVAEERIKSGVKYQDLNSAIHAVGLDISQILMDIMAGNIKDEGRTCGNPMP